MVFVSKAHAGAPPFVRRCLASMSCIEYPTTPRLPCMNWIVSATQGWAALQGLLTGWSCCLGLVQAKITILLSSNLSVWPLSPPEQSRIIGQPLMQPTNERTTEWMLFSNFWHSQSATYTIDYDAAIEFIMKLGTYLCSLRYYTRMQLNISAFNFPSRNPKRRSRKAH